MQAAIKIPIGVFANECVCMHASERGSDVCIVEHPYMCVYMWSLQICNDHTRSFLPPLLSLFLCDDLTLALSHFPPPPPPLLLSLALSLSLSRSLLFAHSLFLSVSFSSWMLALLFANPASALF
jgi:hypothetical protein